MSDVQLSAGQFECVCTSDFMGSNCERGTAFVTIWQTTSDASTITLPLMDSGTYNCTVEWGDASAPDTLTSHTAPKRTHTYALAGTYTVTVTSKQIMILYRVNECEHMDCRSEEPLWACGLPMRETKSD